MKRLASLVAVVFAFAVVPVALADTAQPPAKPAGAPIAKLRLDVLRLRLDLARIRYRVACHDRSSDTCTQFTQKLVDRLTTLDGNVQQKLDGCTKGCTVLQKLDDRLQKLLAKLGSPSSTSPSTSESGLDQAAGDLAGLAKP